LDHLAWHQVLDARADQKGMRKSRPPQAAQSADRADRIRELKHLVESGAYRPDPADIADALVSYARRTILMRRLDGPGHA
jgi:anti-sigma28 factor (negative regulator of flagellin synthesis)